MTRRLSRRSLLRAGAVLAVGAALGPGWPSLAREADSIPLVAGMNTHSWCGPDTPVAEATAGLPLLIAYGWDVAERRWLAYAPNTPIDSIGVLRHGQPLMLRMTADADWRQPWFRGAMPEPVELPVGWSFLGWSGLRETVWGAFGQQSIGSGGGGQALEHRPAGVDGVYARAIGGGVVRGAASGRRGLGEDADRRRALEPCRWGDRIQTEPPVSCRVKSRTTTRRWPAV